MDILEKAVDEIKHANINKEEEEANKKNSYNADTVDMNALEAEMQKHVESDKNDNNRNNKTSKKKENIAKDKNNDNNEGIQVHADWDSNRNESNESECDSEKERLACYAMHPESENEHIDSESISDSYDEHSNCPSDYDEWAKWNEKRWKHKKKVKSQWQCEFA